MHNFVSFSISFFLSFCVSFLFSFFFYLFLDSVFLFCLLRFYAFYHQRIKLWKLFNDHVFVSTETIYAIAKCELCCIFFFLNIFQLNCGKRKQNNRKEDKLRLQQRIGRIKKKMYIMLAQKKKRPSYSVIVLIWFKEIYFEFNANDKTKK